MSYDGPPAETAVKCFNCGQFGHPRRNCPKPSAPAQGGVRGVVVDSTGFGDQEEPFPEFLARLKRDCLNATVYTGGEGGARRAQTLATMADAQTESEAQQLSPAPRAAPFSNGWEGTTADAGGPAGFRQQTTSAEANPSSPMETLPAEDKKASDEAEDATDSDDSATDSDDMTKESCFRCSSVKNQFVSFNLSSSETAGQDGGAYFFTPSTKRSDELQTTARPKIRRLDSADDDGRSADDDRRSVEAGGVRLTALVAALVTATEREVGGEQLAAPVAALVAAPVASTKRRRRRQRGDIQVRAPTRRHDDSRRSVGQLSTGTTVSADRSVD